MENTTTTPGLAPEFRAWPKIPRLSRDCVISEKIDGTNACVVISEDGAQIAAQSRTRIITPENDNYGFAKWVNVYREDLLKLGPGYHFGEWWGPGIQRGYGVAKKTFSLFNTSRWIESEAQRIDEKQQVVPACCKVVPVLCRDIFDTRIIANVLMDLVIRGSVASPGFMRPEGIVIFHTAAGTYFKKLTEGDELPKGETAK